MNKIVKQFPNLIRKIKFSDYFKTDKYNLIKFYDIGTDNSKTKNNIFLMGGEHARELISVETVYRFVKDLVKNSHKRRNKL